MFTPKNIGGIEYEKEDNIMIGLKHIEVNLFPLLRKKPVYCFKKKRWEKYGEITDPISQKLLSGRI